MVRDVEMLHVLTVHLGSSMPQALSLLKSDMDRANIRIAKKDRDIQVCGGVRGGMVSWE